MADIDRATILAMAKNHILSRRTFLAGTTAAPLIFDGQNQPKPALQAIADVTKR
jgi:GH35 family endo-1,4-beta-xylanase